jgi:hypothetical protein
VALRRKAAGIGDLEEQLFVAPERQLFGRAAPRREIGRELDRAARERRRRDGDDGC